MIVARHRELQTRLLAAEREFEEAGGQAGVLSGAARPFDAMCRALRAGEALHDYEALMCRLADLRDEVRARRGLAGPRLARGPLI